MTNDAEIIESNARLMRREIMGRLDAVVHELEQIDGSIDDLPKPRDVEIDLRLTNTKLAAKRLREMLVELGWQ